MLNETVKRIESQDELSFILEKWREEFPAVEQIFVSLLRGEEKFSRKHVHNCFGRAIGALSSSDVFSYDILNEDTSYVYYRILQPLQKYFTNINDSTEISARVNENGSLDSKVRADLLITIPNRQEWVSYIALKYKKLTKFSSNIKGLTFEIVNHKVRSVKVSMVFDFDFNMVKAIKECTINEQFFNNWISTCHVVQRYTKEHTSSIHVTVEEDCMRVHHRSLKVKFSKSIQL
ncbi:hypothetical protein [Bacillus anthracis]|uniref:Uncharacterized protein n=1 Tax=Bacillus anthracis TaxID=1392 RepID=A0A0J1KNW3_BACAN|nr:hypothetical protein [Bacillus anthracis]KLV18350.1 hypothetical protein ABW01_13295 [Bacillus anthracis]